MLNDYLAVSGMPGLYKMVANRKNGLIVEDLKDGRKRFCSVRKHQFTPLGSIAIYTYTDTVPLREVFQSMQDSGVVVPVPNSDGASLETYFEQIVPDYDKNRVYTTDIKKLIKWYNYLLESDLLSNALRTDDEEE